MFKFDLDTPDESSSLPKLDTKIKIQEEGALSTKTFTKTANKIITVPHQSHHTTSTKRDIVRNEFRRAVRSSTLDGRSESMEAATRKLRDNGHPQEWTNEAHQLARRKAAISHQARFSRVALLDQR